MDATLRRLLEAKAIELGEHVVRSTTAGGSGHPSTALSLVHVTSLLLYKLMRFDPADPRHRGNDRLVLSEGHAVPVVYAALCDLGVHAGKGGKLRPLTEADLPTLRALDSVLDGHPNPPEGMPFFDTATGSLGQGLSAAAGLGLAARIDGIPKKVYCIIGDGESREGQIWEAADLIIDYKLTNVVPVFNCNAQGQSDYVSPQQRADRTVDKLTAYGFHARRVNGHDVGALYEALSTEAPDGKPVAVVMDTVKGWGVKVLQDGKSHGKPLTAAQEAQALADLAAVRKEAGLDGVPLDQLKPPGPLAVGPAPAAAGRLGDPDFDQILAGDGYLKTWQAKKILSTRRAYGLAIRDLGKADPRVVALDADVKNSTFADYFYKAIPERFVECRIAEQNMVSVAAGMAAAGKIPFASTFSKFLARALDQVEMTLISGVPVKLAGSHSGVSLAADGPSQMSLPDVAYFRSISHAKDAAGRPMLALFQPSDAVGAYKMVQLAADFPNMAFVRTLRPDLELLYAPSTQFEVGGWHKLAEGKDILLAATGYMVHVAKWTLPKLSAAGVSAGLADCYSFPLKADSLLDLAAKSGSVILTLEDNFVGGLSGEIAEAAARTGKVKVFSMNVEKMPKSAREPEEEIAYVGLDPDSIVAKVKAVLGR
jgi:transketolase